VKKNVKNFLWKKKEKKRDFERYNICGVVEKLRWAETSQTRQQEDIWAKHCNYSIFVLSLAEFPFIRRRVLNMRSRIRLVSGRFGLYFHRNSDLLCSVMIFILAANFQFLDHDFKDSILRPYNKKIIE